jgi:hypothetical protein
MALVSTPTKTTSFGSALAWDAGAPALLALESRQLDEARTASPSESMQASWRAIRKASVH